MKRIAKLKHAARIGLAMVVLIAFAGCFSQTAAPPPSVEDLEVPEFNETALQNISDSAGSDPAAMQAYSLIFTGNIFQALAVAYVQIALEGWDESQPQTYTDESGVYTVTWTESNGVWTWSFEYDDGVDVYTTVISVEATGTGWGLVVSQDGENFVEGILNEDGSEGEVTFFDSIDGAQFVATWGPSSLSGYDQSYTVRYVASSGATEQELVAHYTTDGTAGEWEYTDYLDDANSGSGSWQ